MTASALVSTDWLAAHLASPDVRIADATWFLPALDRSAREEYEAAHIAGAVFFDIDAIADRASPLPHMLPDAEEFASRVQKLGLGDGVRIVLYDNNRFSASARAWWMFRVFGHDDVAVLDGGLAKWRAEGRPVTDEPVRLGERPFTARPNPLLVRDLEQIRDNLRGRREQVLDARAPGRFAGPPLAGPPMRRLTPGSVMVACVRLPAPSPSPCPLRRGSRRVPGSPPRAAGAAGRTRSSPPRRGPSRA